MTVLALLLIGAGALTVLATIEGTDPVTLLRRLLTGRD